ncbi:hypothetical protein Nepgr_031050 [Nepenthes gracilis]|uniref:Non-haem dioxygenase N-terminal domain-containing protein n=1 Tax=Nepenthes gracilis TaxID=150966 RepID=A0AAD3TI47_NEPGR|nr:hypothetical protein Nepgr_031050 [Nepenthes gracilis]
MSGLTTDLTIAAATIEAQKHDRRSELKAFDETKAGVKGLVDAGITKVPRIFINRHNQSADINSAADAANEPRSSVPVIDLRGVGEDAALRRKVVAEVGRAREEWGFFQVINHGIPLSLLSEMINGRRRFHEQDLQVKKQYYSRDVPPTKFKYMSNFDLCEGLVTNWRDTIAVVTAPRRLDPHEMPEVCRYNAVFFLAISLLTTPASRSPFTPAFVSSKAFSSVILSYCDGATSAAVPISSGLFVLSF